MVAGKGRSSAAVRFADSYRDVAAAVDRVEASPVDYSPLQHTTLPFSPRKVLKQSKRQPGTYFVFQSTLASQSLAAYSSISGSLRRAEV